MIFLTEAVAGQTPEEPSSWWAEAGGVGVQALGMCVKKSNTKIKFGYKDALERAFSLKHPFSGKVAKLQILFPILLP